MRTADEISKDNFYKIEDYWGKKNFFQAWAAASAGYYLSLRQGNEGTGFFGAILVGFTLPITYAIYMYYGLRYWWTIRRMRAYGHVKLFEFSKGWGFDFRFYRTGYNDYDYPEIHITLIWGKIFITLPFWKGPVDHFDAPTYGFYYFENAFVLCLGKKSKFYYVPWSFDWYRSSHLMKDYNWYNIFKGDTRRGIKHEAWGESFDAKKWSETYPYTYVLRNGTVQERLATVTIDEREWRRRWLMWTPLFNMVRRTIDIDFDKEIGEGIKSWKGGTTGCSYELLPNETPEQCLRRMESERKFDR